MSISRPLPLIVEIQKYIFVDECKAEMWIHQ